MSKQNGVTKGGFVLSQIHHLSKRIFNKILKEHNIEINPGQGRILFVLWREDNLSIQEIGQRTSLGPSTLTGMLDRMEEAELLERQAHPKDRRKQVICLTQKTKNMNKKYLEVSRLMAEIMYEGLSKEEITLFESFLDRIHANFQWYEENK